MSGIKETQFEIGNCIMSKDAFKEKFPRLKNSNFQTYELEIQRGITFKKQYSKPINRDKAFREAIEILRKFNIDHWAITLTKRTTGHKLKIIVEFLKKDY